MNKSFSRIVKKGDSAVSPVIAVLLIIAITIVLAAVSAVAFISYNIPDASPILGISIKDNNDGTVTVSHLNGAVLKQGEYKILINGVSQDISGFGDFAPGSVIKLNVPSGTTLESVAVVYAGKFGDTLLALKEFGGTAQYLKVNGENYKLVESHEYDTVSVGSYTGYIDISKNGNQVVIVVTRDGFSGSKKITFSDEINLTPGSYISYESDGFVIGLREDSQYLDLIIDAPPYLIYEIIAIRES
ncbi:MAG: type IV pilin N-terminal domain-containing protein [Methanocorpusculum sp.]|nr:type IV pilin N-terminal domain-containing protein [Methanocorpusculum sp.]